MPLNDDALISVADARTYSKLTSEDEPTDAWFEQAVNGVSTQIQSKVGRKYQPRSSTPETRQFLHDGGPTLEIDDCTDLSLVRASNDPQDASTWEDVETEQWIAEPLNEAIKTQVRFLGDIDWPASNIGWDALAFHLGSTTRTQWPVETMREGKVVTVVEVTAKWGHETVPGNIQLAALLWIQYLIQRDVAYFSPDLAEAVIAQGAMPPDVKGIIESEKAKQAQITAV